MPTVLLAARRRRPEPRLRREATTSSSARSAPSTPEAAGTRAAPSAVRRTRRPTRSRSGRPTSASSERSWWLTAGWLQPSSSAARVTCSWRATATNARSWASVISLPGGGSLSILKIYPNERNDSLDRGTARPYASLPSGGGERARDRGAGTRAERGRHDRALGEAARPATLHRLPRLHDGVQVRERRTARGDAHLRQVRRRRPLPRDPTCLPGDEVQPVRRRALRRRVPDRRDVPPARRHRRLRQADLHRVQGLHRGLPV